MRLDFQVFYDGLDLEGSFFIQRLFFFVMIHFELSLILILYLSLSFRISQTALLAEIQL
jgi:hypothetical protein